MKTIAILQLKKCLFLILFTVCYVMHSFSQERLTVNGETLELKTEVDGTIDLLWGIINRQYRYFVRKNGVITELVNTKGDDKTFQEEYKTTLSNLTLDKNLELKKVNLTLASLKRFIDNYNASVDANYKSSYSKIEIQTQLLIFGGVTNNVFVENPNNTATPFAGAEIEAFGINRFSRHAAFFNVRHNFSQNDFDRSNTQLAIGYRYRFIEKSKFNIYGNVKLATFDFISTNVIFNNTPLERINDTSFDAPFIFGLGADIKVSNKVFISLIYNEIFALFQESSDNFPIDFGAGIKFAF